MSSNDRQVGGSHYQKLSYQHWDLVARIELPYYTANATKYLSRWREKGGVEDLKKALHYVEKAQEVRDEEVRLIHREAVRYCEANGITGPEYDIILLLCKGRLNTAAPALRDFLAEIDEAEPGPGYVDQD